MLSSLYREKKRKRQASPAKKKSSSFPSKLKNGLLIASKSQEESDDEPCDPTPVPGDTFSQKLKPQVMYSSTSGCTCNGFVNGKFCTSTKEKEETKSSFFSLILQPKSSVPCYSVGSKRVSYLSEVHRRANGFTTSDQQIFPKKDYSHPALEEFIGSPVCKVRKARFILSQFQIVHDEIPHITRLRQIGLYFGSDLEQNVEWSDMFLQKTGISRQNHLSIARGNDNGIREEQRGARKRDHNRGIHCGRYRATMSFNGVCLNLGSGHSTSAEAAAALDLGQCLLKGSENLKTPTVLSRPELISGLQAAGLPKSHGNRSDPLPSFKVNEVTKLWFESMVENALTSLGGMDYQLSHILAEISE